MLISKVTSNSKAGAAGGKSRGFGVRQSWVLILAPLRPAGPAGLSRSPVKAT